ncbi:DNA-directed RNA polymerase I subunit RPA49-like [Watersipora subatra]|uniref:DNA-directed RNA polymerase I subunit RPA49-like n=1 Tax=Watersipora subatra TaxID=2589382 RepID=UPI00355BEF4E
MSLATTVLVDSNAESLPPLFSVGFTHGVLEPSGYKNVQADIYQHQNSDRLCKLVVQTDQMDYAGNYDCIKRDEGKFIGVEDPETNEMTLIPLKRVRVRPAVSIAEEGSEHDLVPDVKPMTRQEQFESMIEAFGGAKQKRNMQLKRKHAIHKDMIHEALDLSGIDNVSAPTTPSRSADQDKDEQVLPPHDTTTKDLASCYPMDEYFPPNIRADLEEFISELMEVDSSVLADWRKEERYPAFIQDQLEKLPLAEHQRRKRLVIIKYLLFLIKLFNLRANDLKQKDPFSASDPNQIYEMPASCLNYILEHYTIKSGRSRSVPPRIKDKIFVIIILLGLHLENYTLATNQLLSTVKVGTKKLTSISKAMGCKVRVNKMGRTPEIVVTLAAPLTFPVPTARPSFKSRR